MVDEIMSGVPIPTISIPVIYQFDRRSNPLHVAVRNNDLATIQSLLDAGASIEASIDGETSLIVACRQNNLAVVKLLLDNGANIEARNNYECTPMLIAGNGHRGSLEMVKLLLEYGATIFVSNDRGYSLFDTDIYIKEEIRQLVWSIRDQKRA